MNDYMKVGDLVEYRSPGGDVVERGLVTSLGERLVHVRFGTDEHSKACARSRLLIVPSKDR